jgi:[CysO sulfur-carrier protein]-S-L-cysteine hydrolase
MIAISNSCPSFHADAVFSAEFTCTGAPLNTVQFSLGFSANEPGTDTLESGRVLSTPYRLSIPPAIHEAMVRQAVAELPNECCGLLAGRIDGGVALVTRHFPLVNDAADATRQYRSESRSILAAHRAMRDLGVDLVAVYHSHPTSEARPSRTDIADNAYGDSLLHLIISLQSGQPEVRGWWLSDQEFWEGKWEIAENDGCASECGFR